MLAVEEQHDERLVRQRRERQPQVVAHRLGRRERAAVRHFLAKQPTRKLDARLELRGLGGTETLRACELGGRRAEQRRQASMLTEQVARHIERRRARGAAAQHDREQLGVGKRRRAVGDQPLARAFAGGPFGDVRHDE